ncbi:MAG: STN domain-containing protein [Gammaproteobacteria bacterium]
MPPQPLYSALDALAEHAGLQLVYSAELVKAIDSPGLTGDYTAEGALTRLLAGTGLAYRYTDRPP